MMLKRKLEVNYRKAVTTRDGRFARCRCCMNRTFMRYDWRCQVIGLENSRRHAAAGDCVCDKYKGSRIQGVKGSSEGGGNQ